MSRETIALPIRLGALPVPAKVMLTCFLLLVSAGYGIAVLNIYEHNQDADLEPGLSLDDLRVRYHGWTKPPAPAPAAPAPASKEGEPAATAPAGPVSPMLKMVLPGGAMRKYLDKGGETAARALVSWLQAGSKKEDFTREGVFKEGDPSVSDVLADQCIKCHNAQSGKKKDVPYAASSKADPDYEMVAKQALASAAASRGEAVYLAPMALSELIQSTHAHILSIPVFALAVGCMFFLTRQRPAVKAILGPLPMIGAILDIGGWWLARPFEPGIYVIAAAGGIFGGSLALQTLCILGSLWLGRRGRPEPAGAPEDVGSLLSRSSR
jgi:hypothetical protein